MPRRFLGTFSGVGVQTERGEFRHEALFYADDEEFLEATSAFLSEGVEQGSPSLAVLSADKIVALRREMAERAEAVVFADMAEVGRNPARIIPAWQKFVDEHGTSGRELRGIGEPIWRERSSAELVECQHHESLLNVAFADSPPFRLLCPYDSSALPGDVLEEARRSHPVVTVEGSPRPSEAFRGLADLAAPLSAPLSEPPRDAESTDFRNETLLGLHDLVARCASAAGLGAEEVEDFVLAVHEAATNSVRHGGGGGVLRVWNEDGTVICEVRDQGSFARPLAGRERPRVGQTGGWGLWMANQVCDLVQIRALGEGTAVRLFKRAGTRTRA